MTEDVYRILYCSRNCMTGSMDEQQDKIANILAKSRANNPRHNITGALLFNSGFFAQVLEGPLQQVERTFERIQCDMRHDDVSVLECGMVAQRDFPEWSMGYASGANEQASGYGDLSLAKMLANQTTAAAEVSSLLRSLVLEEDEVSCV